jgi:hypothetical protein
MFATKTGKALNMQCSSAELIIGTAEIQVIPRHAG